MQRGYSKRRSRGKSKVSPAVSQTAAKPRKELPRGCLYRHQKTHGFYFKIRWPGDDKISDIPLVPAGKKHATKQRQIALAIAKRLLRRRLGAAADQAATGLGMNDWITQFERHCLLQTRKPDSQQPQHNAGVCRRFTAEQKIRTPWEITPDNIENYLLSLLDGSTGRPLTRKTIVNHQCALQKFCRFLLRKGQIDGNPFDLLDKVSAGQRSPRRVPDAIVAELLRKAGRCDIPDLREAVGVAVYCGLRLSEIMALRWLAIEDGPGGMALVVGEKNPTKSDSWRATPVPPVLQKAIARLRRRCTVSKPGDPIFAPRAKWTWIRQFKRLTADLAVFGEVSDRPTVGNQWHALRSFCAMKKATGGNSVNRGPALPLPQLCYEMGWKSFAMAQRYINIAQAAGVAN